MTLQEKLFHQKQMANAIQRQDEFYTLDVDDRTKHIELPTPQVCGTITQQRTYAMDKAISLIETFNK